MIEFFAGESQMVIAVKVSGSLDNNTVNKLSWLFGNAQKLNGEFVEGTFIGPRKEMITPWCTNAVEITQNMGVKGIERIEEFYKTNDTNPEFDPMLQKVYNGLNQEIFTILREPQPIIYIEDIAAFNKQEGLALSNEEIMYLEDLSKNIGRKLTDSEIFGFSQVNSEHCRHKIFNGTFIIDGDAKEKSLFQLIKLTSQINPNRIVSAYKDNCAFIQGPMIEQFAPKRQDVADFFEVKDIESVISLKAETHNFPTTVEPFNGAATGSGGEIRDRIGGGKAAFPIAGTAVYMTSYSRVEEGRAWEAKPPRKWLYQTPEEILIKASNGASDFGNKFGQPLICGSILTFEHEENDKKFGFDKVIMLAGGVGFANKKDAIKGHPKKGDKVILLGGDNYRIGMGGGAVSSVATGEFDNAIELNAVQRSNPEMQKRVYNAIRALGEDSENPIISIHDHGAGGHLNCLSELVEETGGEINMENLPVGDPTLSAKELIGNESQERMGLVLHEKDIDKLKHIAERERAPMYVIGTATGDHQFTFVNVKTGEKPMDLQLANLFGNPPKTVMQDNSEFEEYSEIKYEISKIHEYLELVLQLEAVACKDWLTNKVDRSVTGRIALQQTCGEIQLPLNNLGVVTLDYQGKSGIATSIGHAPVSGLVDAASGSVLSIAEALTNIIWAPLQDGIKGISLSANWMWPCKNKGEDARLYEAVEAASKFAIALGLNIPTGKDSLSMTQKYQDGVVYSPGTVIISAVAEVIDIRKTVSPVVENDKDTQILYIDLSRDAKKLGGSSLAQVLNSLGKSVPTIKDAGYFVKAFGAVQELIEKGLVLAGHDVSSGGLITALLEMTFANDKGGLKVNLDSLGVDDTVKMVFNENPALIIQVKDFASTDAILKKAGILYTNIGNPCDERIMYIEKGGNKTQFDIQKLRDVWFRTSYLLDRKQSGEKKALERYNSYKTLKQDYRFLPKFSGKASDLGIKLDRREASGVKAAIIREKGVNGDREMAFMMYLAGMDVKDIHMTDLVSGRENLEDINMIVFVGGFSNSDVLGSAKGWAGAFLYNDRANQSLENFYKRPDTLSLGVCNGCQLMIELGLVTPDHDQKPHMKHNDSHKFESEFLSVDIIESNSVMLKSLAGSRLGIWVAHGEGKFVFPYTEDKYNVTMKYSYEAYPGNPNGSQFNVAGICSEDGRHLAMMPHLERAIYPWNWAYYPQNRKNDEVSPWMEAFVNAREWIKSQKIQ
ncbi:MAG: phosphoribosylformylglycinamidine synthase [Bacteroidales bacterium]|nr:phosphoribosylformylglycinamidine synthase [Bacteroidales bacterium]